MLGIYIFFLIPIIFLKINSLANVKISSLIPHYKSKVSSTKWVGANSFPLCFIAVGDLSEKEIFGGEKAEIDEDDF